MVLNKLERGIAAFALSGIIGCVQVHYSEPKPPKYYSTQAEVLEWTEKFLGGYCSSVEVNPEGFHCNETKIRWSEIQRVEKNSRRRGEDSFSQLGYMGLNIYTSAPEPKLSFFDQNAEPLEQLAGNLCDLVQNCSSGEFRSDPRSEGKH